MAKIMNTVQEETAVDSLRPYTDAEIPAAMKRMANDPTLGEMVAFAFPGIPLEAVREKLLQVRSADGFQQAFRAADAGEYHTEEFDWIHLRRRRTYRTRRRTPVRLRPSGYRARRRPAATRIAVRPACRPPR